MKFKAMYKYSNEKDVVIGVFDERDKAIDACLNYRSGDYCLDDRESRKHCLELRDFCILGCGPGELSIEEVDE